MKNLIKNTAKYAAYSKFILPAIALAAIAFGYMTVQAFTSNAGRVSSASCQGICVNIERGGMNPTELAVKTGEFIQFNTADGQKHNLSLGDGHNSEQGSHDPQAHDHSAGFESGEFGPGEAYRVQFKKPGTFVMHDHDHPTNRILIVVYNPSK